MDKTLCINKYLVKALLDNEYIATHITDKRINPLGQPEGTPYPHITYRRDSLVPEYTKHLPMISNWTNRVTVSFSVWSEIYDEAVEIANIVRDILENYSYQDEDIKIYPLELTYTSEAYANDAFQQLLTFSTTAE